MTTLHVFGCSISQGFALPDVVKPAVNEQGKPLTDQEIIDRGIHWSEIHLYQPSQYAWPQVLADRLGVPVHNHARRGACFQQISRQCAMGATAIAQDDVAIVMWTYLSRLSLQWPARTSVPFGSLADPQWGWRTVMVGFNKLFGLTPSKSATEQDDRSIQQYIESSTQYQLDPMGQYNRYYNNLVLQQMTHGFLQQTGARVIHLSVETEPALQQLEMVQQELPRSLREDYSAIANPSEWYTLGVDYDSCFDLLDPSIPPAENDTHPSIQHHQNFAELIHTRYFR